jgi:outer membrane protein TolC
VDDVPMAEEDAMRMALALRLDFRIAKGRVEDARRGVRVSADALRAGLSLTVSGTSGGRRTVSSAAQEDAEIRIDQGTLRAAVGLQLPWERTAERNAYRKSLLALDAAERAAEAAEDQVKGDVRSTYRTLSQSREVCGIQEQALALADRRVKSTELLLEAGRAEMRDLVEARDSLLQAQNSVIAARINYRMAELGLWRTVESLRVTEDGVMGDVHVAGP